MFEGRGIGIFLFCIPSTGILQPWARKIGPSNVSERQLGQNGKMKCQGNFDKKGRKPALFYEITSDKPCPNARIDHNPKKIIKNINIKYHYKYLIFISLKIKIIIS